MIYKTVNVYANLPLFNETHWTHWRPSTALNVHTRRRGIINRSENSITLSHFPKTKKNRPHIVGSPLQSTTSAEGKYRVKGFSPQLNRTCGLIRWSSGTSKKPNKTLVTTFRKRNRAIYFMYSKTLPGRSKRTCYTHGQTIRLTQIAERFPDAVRNYKRV